MMLTLAHYGAFSPPLLGRLLFVLRCWAFGARHYALRRRKPPHCLCRLR